MALCAENKHRARRLRGPIRIAGPVPTGFLARMPGYLKGVGITPVVTVPYSLASQEAGKPPSAWGRLPCRHLWEVSEFHSFTEV